MNEFEFETSAVKLTTYNVNDYTLFIDDDIVEPSYYREILHVLRAATDSDLVNIQLTTSGGSLETSVMILNAINACQANVTLTLDHQASSGGSMIMMSSVDEYKIMPYSSMMVHYASLYGVDGKASDIESYMRFLRSNTNELFEALYKGFLTEDELNNVMYNGAELYFNSEEIITRLNNKNNPEPAPKPKPKRARKVAE